MNGQVNTRNLREYAPKGICLLLTMIGRIQEKKQAFGLGFAGNGAIIGPYFSQGNINGWSYLQMVNFWRSDENFVLSDKVSTH